jgi:hypothetical protein
MGAILQVKGLAAFDAVGLALVVEPNIDHRGIVDDLLVGAGLQILVGSAVIVDLDIGGVPNIIPAADVGGEMFDAVPVMVIFKFVAVAEEVKQPVLAHVADLLFHKCFGQVHELRVVVMASWVKGKPVYWETKVFGTVYRFCINNTTLSKNINITAILIKKIANKAFLFRDFVYSLKHTDEELICMFFCLVFDCSFL